LPMPLGLVLAPFGNLRECLARRLINQEIELENHSADHLHLYKWTAKLSSICL
jgi:hypothetical protein